MDITNANYKEILVCTFHFFGEEFLIFMQESMRHKKAAFYL